MPYVSPACETAEELFETLVQDVLHATCSAQGKLHAANRLVRFCTHPEPSLLLQDREPDIPPPDPEAPESEPPPSKGLAQAFGL